MIPTTPFTFAGQTMLPSVSVPKDTVAKLAEAAAPDAAFGMPVARRTTLRTLAEAVAGGTLHLDPGADRAETEARLLAISGIGPWTAQYVAMRALGDPDVGVRWWAEDALASIATTVLSHLETAS